MMKVISYQPSVTRKKIKIFRYLFSVICLLLSVFFAKTAPVLFAENVFEETKEQLLRENVKFRDQVSDLERELTKQKNLNEQLEKKAKEFFLKLKELKPQAENAKNLVSTVEFLNKQRIILKGENDKLRQEIAALNESFKKENANTYQKLGIAYTQAKLYDMAIDAYEKSLSYDPRNAQVHYNLGLLYKYSGNYISKSIHHFKKYLSLNPKAKNREEVKYLINMLAEKGRLPVEMIF